MNVEQLAHKIAECAIAESDNVNMYSAVKDKVIELMNKFARGMEDIAKT